jgi:hypothetical protein
VIEKNRPAYRHPGFTKDEIIAAKENFVDYMETHVAPVGGTSGAGGGAPKFLLREDYNGRFHADGYLDDTKTKQVPDSIMAESKEDREMILTQLSYI